MSKKINLYWYKIKDGHGNFGDELNHYLISKLTGQYVNNVIIPSTGFDYIYRSLSFVYFGVVGFSDYPKLLRQYFLRDFIVAIGSVIAVVNSSRAKIWGSGIIKKDDKINKALFYAVRGKYSQKRLLELGLEAPDAIGDPAILTPLVYKSKTTKKYKLGIIPHHIHYNQFSSTSIDDILVINLTDPIEKILDEVHSCEYTISTSLHGIIISQAYGIPSLWFTFNGKALYGDNIKFYDYFSSVDIKEYAPFQLEVNTLQVSEVLELFNTNKELTQIKDLNKCQKMLLKAAPFEVLNKFTS